MAKGVYVLSVMVESDEDIDQVLLEVGRAIRIQGGVVLEEICISRE